MATVALDEVQVEDEAAGDPGTLLGTVAFPLSQDAADHIGGTAINYACCRG